MGLFGRRQPDAVTREQAMAARPVRHPEIETTVDEKGEVSLKIPRRKVWWVNLFARFGGVPAFRIVTLDEVGTKVWNLCDGAHTVQELVQRLAEDHKLSRKEAEISLFTFLRTLMARGYIALAVDEKKPAGDGKQDGAK